MIQAVKSDLSTKLQESALLHASYVVYSVLCVRGGAEKLSWNLEEIEEFQSTIILAQSDSSASKLQIAADHFIAAFLDAQMLARSQNQLRLSGHFDYQQVATSIPMNEPREAMAQRKIEATKALEEWNSILARTRAAGYAANWFNNRQIGIIVNALQRGSAGNLAISLLQSFSSAEHSDSFFQCALKHWVDESSSSEADAFSVTACQGSTAQLQRSTSRKAILADTAPELELSNLESVVGSAAAALDLAMLETLSSTICEMPETVTDPESERYLQPVSLILLESHKDVDKQAMLLYRHAESAPTRDTCVFCTGSEFDDVERLLLRWAASERYGRERQLYSLISVDSLTVDEQSILLQKISQMQAGTDARLVLLATKNCLVATELAESTLEVPSGSSESIRKYLSNSLWNLMAVLSPDAGSGKTFAVRQMASEEDLTYVHCPINRALSRAEFVSLLQLQTHQCRSHTSKTVLDMQCVSTIAADKQLLVHIDVADQVDTSFNSLLLECAVFGSILDHSGCAFTLPTHAHGRVVVELACGRVGRESLMAQLPILKFLPRVFQENTSPNLCISAQGLATGGHVDTSCHEYSPAEQLQFVCYALHILENGFFGPYSRLLHAGRSSMRSALVTRIEEGVGFYARYEDDPNETEHFFTFKDKSIIRQDSSGSFPSKYVGPEQHAELDGSQCLALLMKYASEKGAGASFWSLWTFVSFLHHQLREMEIPSSPIALVCGNDESVKFEFVKYLVRTANEFAGSQIEADGSVRPWAASDHDCLLFSNSTSCVHFLSLSPLDMRSRMPTKFVDLLDARGIHIGKPLEELNAEFHDILGALTGIERTIDDALNLLSHPFVLTGDGVIKLLAIAQRLHYGIPVLLMGECGCGKTTIIKYLAAWLAAELIVLDVHGGTTEQGVKPAA